jgi:hypothetical protein
MAQSETEASKLIDERISSAGREFCLCSPDHVLCRLVGYGQVCAGRPAQILDQPDRLFVGRHHLGQPTVQLGGADNRCDFTGRAARLITLLSEAGPRGRRAQACGVALCSTRSVSDLRTSR